MFQVSSTQTKMTSIEKEQKSQSQTPLLFLDCLHCEEKYLDDDGEEHEEEEEEEEEDDEEQLFVLFSKEEKRHFSEGELELEASKSLMAARKEALDWIVRVIGRHNFSVLTLVLGVNYLDRFMMKFGYQKETPWTTQLAAVACLSLASKIQETHVPLLSDFQVESKYRFEAKSIQRMELLVMSTLEWKMNAVTPLSYFGHLITRLKLKTHLHWDILRRCHSLILSAIVDPKFLCYVPSVLAVATTVLALKELGLWSNSEHQINVIETFKLNKDKVEECQHFIKELSSNANEKSHKRKCLNSADSPKNVLDAVFCESSKDSSISLLSSPESLPKRSRIYGSHCFE